MKGFQQLNLVHVKEVAKELFNEKCDKTQRKVGGDLVIKHY
jgi:hypothetical protein